MVKLFLKKPEQSQGLVQKVLQAATVENDNPDIRDRAYVYWRLLSSDPQITKSVVLSEKPPITSTIQSLPAGLLETLINELSTLASVYHKPPESFLGQGRFGAEAMQKAAIEYVATLTVEFHFLTIHREQLQLAQENPIAAAAAAAAVSGGTAPQSNIENLLDIDFDGSAPASLQKEPSAGSTGLEGLAGTPLRVASPATGTSQPNNNMDDLMGLFGASASNGPSAQSASGAEDLMNGFAGLDMGGSQPPPGAAQQSESKRTNEDILGLF